MRCCYAHGINGKKIGLIGNVIKESTSGTRQHDDDDYDGGDYMVICLRIIL